MLLAEGPGVARGKKWKKKIILKLCENEYLQKISAQSIQPFGWLYATYIFTNVLFYYIDLKVFNQLIRNLFLIFIEALKLK